MYFVSTRGENDHKDLFGGAWGYFWDKTSAVDAVQRNVTDIHETIYPYAIFECLEQGLFPVPKERQWFGWQEEKQGFYEMEPPECDKYYPCNFSIALGTAGNEHSAYTESLTDIVDQNSPNYFITVMSSYDSEGTFHLLGRAGAGTTHPLRSICITAQRWKHWKKFKRPVRSCG